MIDDRVISYNFDDTENISPVMTPIKQINLANLSSTLWEISDFDRCGTPDCACHGDCYD